MTISVQNNFNFLEIFPNQLYIITDFIKCILFSQTKLLMDSIYVYENFLWKFTLYDILQHSHDNNNPSLNAHMGKQKKYYCSTKQFVYDRVCNEIKTC